MGTNLSRRLSCTPQLPEEETKEPQTEIQDIDDLDEAEDEDLGADLFFEDSPRRTEEYLSEPKEGKGNRRVQLSFPEQLMEKNRRICLTVHRSLHPGCTAGPAVLEVVQHLDSRSHRYLSATSRSMRKRLQMSAKPKQMLLNFSISSLEKDRRQCPFSFSSQARIQAECDGKKIDWHIQDKKIIVRKTKDTFIRRRFTLEEIFRRITHNAQWSTLTICRFFAGYTRDTELFNYRGKSVTVHEILTLLNASSCPMPRLPPIDLDRHFATVEVCLNPDVLPLRSDFGVFANILIEPECGDPLYSWNFDERFVYSCDYKCLVVHRHQLDAMPLLKWVLEGLRNKYNGIYRRMYPENDAVIFKGTLFGEPEIDFTVAEVSGMEIGIWNQQYRFNI